MRRLPNYVADMEFLSMPVRPCSIQQEQEEVEPIEEGEEQENEEQGKEEEAEEEEEEQEGEEEEEEA